MELHPGFSFTKGCPVMKIKGKDKYKVGAFGNLLYDVEHDPGQLKPLCDEAAEREMIRKMAKLMEENDCPPEQYARLGIEDMI